MALGMDVGLGPGHIVLDGNPASLSKKGAEPPPNFGPISIVVKPLYVSGTTWYGGRPQPMRHCVTWGPSSPSPKREQPPILANIRCGQTVGWTKMPLDMEVGLGPGDFAFDGDPAPPENRAQPHLFLAHVYCG